MCLFRAAAISEACLLYTSCPRNGDAMGIGICFSTRRNYRRREEHGSAKWGDAKMLNRKYAHCYADDHHEGILNVHHIGGQTGDEAGA